MNISRRNFLKSAAASTAVAVLAISAPQVFAQSATEQLRPNEHGSRQNPFDIRRLRREMSLPEGKGPFLTVPVLMKKDPVATSYTNYYITIDASLLHSWIMSPEELIKYEQMTGRKIEKLPAIGTRSTIAFFAQFNPEIYMTFDEMRNHVTFYKPLSDGTLDSLQKKARNQILLEVSDAEVELGLREHLMNAHSMHSTQIGTFSNNKPVLYPTAVFEARKTIREGLAAGTIHLTPVASSNAGLNLER